MNSAEARPFSDFKWKIDETYHRDGHVQFVVQKGSENFLPIGIYGKSDVTVNLHPTIGNDQLGPAKLPRGVDIYFEPSRITVAEGERKTVKLIINVDENTPANLYNVQIVGTWNEEGKILEFMGSSIRLHVGKDFGDGKIPVNFDLGKIKQLFEDGVPIQEIPCKNDYIVIIKKSTGYPACVKPSTVEKLVERGWASENSNQSIVDPNIPQVVIEEEGILLIKNTQEYKTLIDEYGEDIVSVKAVNLLDVKDTLFLKEIDNNFKQSPGCIIVLEYKNDEGYIYQLDEDLNIVHQMSFLKFTESAKNIDSKIMDKFYQSLK